MSQIFGSDNPDQLDIADFVTDAQHPVFDKDADADDIELDFANDIEFDTDEDVVLFEA